MSSIEATAARNAALIEGYTNAWAETANRLEGALVNLRITPDKLQSIARLPYEQGRREHVRIEGKRRGVLTATEIWNDHELLRLADPGHIPAIWRQFADTIVAQATAAAPGVAQGLILALGYMRGYGIDGESYPTALLTSWNRRSA